ncbi:hypothetical protein [Acidovorax sp. Q11]
MSIGIALCGPGDSAGAALQRADEAMYLTKQRGCNRVELSGPAAATTAPAVVATAA